MKMGVGKTMKYNNLRAEMKRANLTGKELARILKLSPQAVYMKLSGRVSWSVGQAVIVRNVLSDILNQDLTLEYLFGANNDN